MINSEFIFKCKHDDWTTIEYRIERSLELSELMREFTYFLLAVGFQPESVKEYIPDA